MMWFPHCLLLGCLFSASLSTSVAMAAPFARQIPGSGLPKPLATGQLDYVVEPGVSGHYSLTRVLLRFRGDASQRRQQGDGRVDRML